jgi:hypothetical protein
MDLYARQMVALKRNNQTTYRVVGVIVGLAVAVGIGFMWKARKHNAGVQEKLNYAERFVELEKRETGAFWNCVMASEVDVGMFAKAEQFQQRIESAYFTQQKTFSDYLVSECVPKLERARQAFSGLRDAPEELQGPIETYRQTLPKLQAGLEDYAENIKKRGTVKDVDQLIQEMGNAWHSTPDPTAEAVAFEKFLYCAVPGLGKMKDAQALLEFLADQCFKKDPVAFMDKVRANCGPLVSNVDKDAKVNAKSVPTWKTTHKLFFEDEARQLRAWESCGKKSRKGKKKEDLDGFIGAVEPYMKARAGVREAAKEIK